MPNDSSDVSAEKSKSFNLLFLTLSLIILDAVEVLERKVSVSILLFEISSSIRFSNSETSTSVSFELDKFKCDKSQRKTFRKRYNFKEDDKVIIGIGLYIERKGIVDFVELAKRLKDYKFIWFGYSPLSAATKEVREAVNTKLDNLTFAGYVEQEKIIEAMNGLDLYIFPTFEETEGIPIIEACACKTKALIRDIPIFEDWLEDGVNVYKAKDIDEFEKKIVKIVNNELPDLTEEAYKVAEERDIKIIGKKLKEVYESVLEEN